MPGRHARQTPEWTGGAEDLTSVVQCCRPCGGRQQALSPTGTPRSGPAGQAALGMSTEPQSSGGFQSSLAVCALGEAAGMQEWAVGGSQGRAASQQRAEGDAGRGTPAAFAASSRPSHPPMPLCLPAAVYTPGPSQSKFTGRGRAWKRFTGRDRLLAEPHPATLPALLLSHALPATACPILHLPILLLGGSMADAELSAAANPG